MIHREQYTPGPASGARVQKDRGQNGEEKWTLILVRELRHSPGKVWQALTDPAHLREWAPFDADGSLGTVGTTVKLTTVGAPVPRVTETTVTRADAPEVLEYKWGGFDMRWELEASDGGTRLTLWTNIGHRFIAMGAAGWHICFDVLDRLLNGTPIGRIAGPKAMSFHGWKRLNAEYAQQFLIETPKSALRTVKLLRYVELKSGHSDNGPAWIGYVTSSKTGRTLYFNGRGLMKLKGQRRGESGGNYMDMETGESFWVSGVKKNGEDRHWAGSGKVLIEAAAVSDYLKAIGAKTLNSSRCEVTNSISQTDIKRLSQIANSSGKGWPDDPEAQTPYSFVRNVTSSNK